MITSIRYRGFSFYYKDNDNKYKEIFDEILAYNFKTVKVLRNIDDTKVSLIDTKYGRYVFTLSQKIKIIRKSKTCTSDTIGFNDQILIVVTFYKRFKKTFIPFRFRSKDFKNIATIFRINKGYFCIINIT